MTILDRIADAPDTDVAFRSVKREHSHYIDDRDPFRRILRPYVIMEIGPGVASILVDSDDRVRRFVFRATAVFACWRITRRMRRQPFASDMIDSGLFRYVPRKRRGTKVRLNVRTLRWEFES